MAVRDCDGREYQIGDTVMWHSSQAEKLISGTVDKIVQYKCPYRKTTKSRISVFPNNVAQTGYVHRTSLTRPERYKIVGSPIVADKQTTVVPATSYPSRF